MRTILIVAMAVIVLANFANGVYADSLYGYVKDTANSPISGITVALTNNSGNINSSVTDANGLYNFSFSIATGVYNIHFNATSSYQNVTVAKVLFAGSDTEVNQTMQSITSSVASVSGKVTNSAGSGISGVAILFEGPTVDFATTNSSGDYAIQIKAGAYAITASKAGYLDSIVAANLTSGTDTVNFTLSTTPPTIIQGYVKDSENNTLNITVNLKLNGATVSSSVTDASGFYSFTTSPGIYNVSAAKVGYMTNTTKLTVGVGEQRILNLTLPVLGTLTGTITNGDSAAVELSQNGVVKGTTTANSAGNYAITVAKGVYTITISKSGFKTETSVVNISALNTTVFSITLAATPSTTQSSSSPPPATPSSAITQTSITPPTTTNVGCVENWECSGWSSCADGKERRACTDKNSCGTVSNKPVEERTCSVTEENVADILVPQTKEGINSIDVGSATPLSKVEIVTNKDKENVRLILSEILEEEVPVELKVKVFSYISIDKFNISDDDIDSVELSFKVLKSWLLENNVEKENITLYRLSGSTWSELETQLIDEDTEHVSYKSQSSSFSIFAIGERSVSQAQPPLGITGFFINAVKNPVSVGIATLLAIVALFALWMFEKKSKQEKTNVRKKARARK